MTNYREVNQILSLIYASMLLTTLVKMLPKDIDITCSPMVIHLKLKSGNETKLNKQGNDILCVNTKREPHAIYQDQIQKL